MAAFDMPEQLDSQALHLIGANACSYRLAGYIEVPVKKVIGERAHRQLRAVVMFEHNRAVARHSNRRMKLMRLAAQSDELVACRGAVRRLAENARAERKCLIGAEHQTA